MRRHAQVRRYLVRFDTRELRQINTDCAVIGSGLAGLRAALEVAPAGSVTLLTKSGLSDSNSYAAQGGIAAVMTTQDSVEAHAEDTLRAGCGLCDESVVRTVISDGPKRVQELIDWGAKFDRADGSFALTREGGHSTARILRARGDATGEEITDILTARVAEAKNITVLEDTFALDLLTADERVVGVLAWQGGGPVAVFARRTILATGGLGQIFRETTNPDVATGDGLAMAYRAGADLADMEFIQFHPTTLYLAGASRQLISETVRGEGAYLIDKNGRRFMFDYHADGELAPRDVVSQAIVRQMALTRSTQVFLDLRHLDAKHVRVRFPNIWQTCAEFDIDISEDLIPVRPSAHYMIGGIAVDDEGRTTLENLLACGEVASTGLHGANRLGSNSLLEALVYGRVTGRVVAEEISAERRPAETPPITSQIDESMRANLNIRDVRNSLKAAMWRNVGIERRGTQLAETDKSMEFWQSYVLDKVFADSEGWELQNMLSLGRLMAHAALLREETRGVHHRVDFPERDDANWSRHTIIRRGQPAKSV